MAQHTNPLTNARYPDSASAVNLDTYFANIVNDLSPMTAPPFSTAAARDTAFANWVSTGNFMRDGLLCTVGGILQMYRGGSWRGVAFTSASQTTFFQTTISDSVEYGIATLAIPDPGFPYILDTSAVVAMAAQAGVQVSIRIRLDSVTGTVISQDSVRSGALPAGEVIPIPLGTWPSGTLTGAHSAVVTARRTLGTGNWACSAGGSIVNCMVRPSFA